MENKKKNHKSHKKMRLWPWIAAAVVIAAGCGVMWAARICMAQYQGDEVRIYLPSGSTPDAITDSLRAHIGDDLAVKTMRIWSFKDGRPAKAAGSYVIKPGMNALTISRKLLSGAQDPVKVTFNNVRTLEQLAERISKRLDMEAADFIAACDSVLPAAGYSKPNFLAAFLPDTYEFYWTAKPEYVVGRLEEVKARFWTDDRVAKARALGLTPEQVCTVASIVEEETNKADERPVVARLYLNRLAKGMKLQADPTVKFAIGDFGLRRITNRHLGIDSPYNTYMHEGLPPGPIRIVERQTIDDVLNAPEHDYLFMCAKEDFSGYHNFAVSAEEHAANARRYHQALNRRGIN